MSPSLSRLILSVVFLASILLVVFLVAMISFEVMNLRSVDGIFFVLLSSAAYMVLGWLGIWRGAVKWTPWRRSAIAVSLLGCLLAGALLGLLINSIMSHSEEVAMLFGGGTWALLWLASTALIWRETKAERIERLKLLGINAVACPNCGYNLTGMTTTTCPECGSKYTLDTLYANLRKTDEQVEQV
jgi:hypothetical protein